MRSSLPVTWTLVLFLVTPGRVHATDPSRRVAVLPVLCLGISKPECNRIRSQLIKPLTDRGDLRLILPAKVEAAIRGLCKDSRWECLEVEENLYQLCGRLRADTIESGKMVAMDKAQVLRLRMVDCKTRTVTWENIEMTRLDPDAIKTRSLALYDRMFPVPQAPPQAPLPPLPASTVPEQPAEPAWYQKWQNWVFSGTVLAVMLGGLVLGLQGGQESTWDIHLSIP